MPSFDRGLQPALPDGLRNRGLLVTLCAAGLRCSEALALHPRDLDNGILRVRRGKGGRYRTVALDPEAWAVLQAWLERKARMGIGGPVFSTLHGEPMQTSYVRSLFKRLGSKAHISKRCHRARIAAIRLLPDLPMKRWTFASSNARLDIAVSAQQPATLTT